MNFFTKLFRKAAQGAGHINVIPELLPFDKGITVLHLRCSGYYEPGSAGREQAEKIYNEGASALLSTEADAILVDISDLEYTWGDDLLLVFDIPSHDRVRRDDCPSVVLVGPKCQTAFKSLLEEGCDNWLESGVIYFDKPSALKQLTNKL